MTRKELLRRGYFVHGNQRYFIEKVAEKKGLLTSKGKGFIIKKGETREAAEYYCAVKTVTDKYVTFVTTFFGKWIFVKFYLPDMQ